MENVFLAHFLRRAPARPARGPAAPYVWISLLSEWKYAAVGEKQHRSRFGGKKSNLIGYGEFDYSDSQMVSFGEWSLLVYVLLAVMVSLGRAQVITRAIRVLSSPGNCYGGQPCKTQPSVNVFNAQGELDIGFTGYAYVSVYAAPGSKSVFLGTCSVLDSGCSTATEISGAYGRAYFVNGIAQFKGIMFKFAGVGYQLKFVGSDSGNDFGYTLSSTFDVFVGEPYRLQFATFIGAAFGGLPFSPNPSIAIVDRGGNQVSVSSGKITASLVQSPYATERLRTLDTFDAFFSSGVASYSGLYLNTAGGPYAVSFITDIVIAPDGIKRTLSIVSREFSVAVGAPFTLAFASSLIASSTVYAGEFLRATPRLKILDAGGNIITSDSTSGVQVAIYENPAKATIGPANYLFAKAISGFVTFTTLMIDKAANGFRLSFTLSSYSSVFNAYTPTSVILYSERFDVNIGPPRKLASVVYGDDSWAGGQPMGTQPVIAFQDNGDNVLQGDFSSAVTCSMVSSLATQRTIVVDTSRSDSTFVKSVDVNVASGVYGTGHKIWLNVHFNYEVWVLTSFTLSLRVDVSNPLGTTPYAYLVGSKSQTKTLTFEYLVAANDSSRAFDYLGVNALRLNGALIVNGNNRTVQTTLPVSGVKRNTTVVIDTSKPFIKSIESQARGVFTVNDVIDINVTFSAKVSVVGVPYLTLTSVSVLGTTLVAPYSATGVNGKSVIFSYMVGEGESSPDLSVRDIVLPAGALVLLSSTNPQTYANITIGSAKASLFTAQHSIVVDSTVPKLLVSYGAIPVSSRKVGYTGDTISFKMKFDTEVAISGSFTVMMNTGGVAIFRELYPDGKTIVLDYIVEKKTANLDIAGSSFVLSPDAYIRRQSRNPSLNANLSTQAIFQSTKSLRASAIVIRGEETVVESVTLNRTNQVNPTALYVDDYAIIRVKFSTPVVFSCDPVIVMSLNSTSITRYATYLSGAGSDAFLFKYVVKLGDNFNLGIRYRYAPNALCLEMNCPVITSCTALANSDKPSYPVNIQMPAYSVDPYGVPISSINIDAGMSVRNTHTRISSIECTVPAGEYGAGNFITFDVKFNDEVLVAYPSLLMLHLNIGEFAVYSGGSGTNVLTFTYATTERDSTAQLYPMRASGGSLNTPVNCTLPCALTNRLQGSVNVTNPKIVLQTGIVLDPTPPIITSVWSDKPVSPYDGVYTVGEVINVFVVFSKPISVSSPDLRLMMDVGISDRYALFVSSGLDFVKFEYVVASGDYSPNLVFSGRALDTKNGRGQIYRYATAQVTAVDYTLPPSRPLIAGSGKLFINTLESPRVLAVSAVSPSGTYFTGDRILFKLVTSHFAVLNGRAVVNMNLGDHISQATFCGTNGTTFLDQPPLPSIASKEFYFQIKVKPGDYTGALDYTDAYCFSLEKNDLGNPGSLFQASSTPSVACNLDLPSPGQVGSLSTGSKIKIDGSAPYLSGLGYVTPAGTYGAGQEIVIKMDLSLKVVITGSPFIVLETGVRKRRAVFMGLSGQSSLLFSYIIQPGDISLALDYNSDRGKLQSAVESFQLNGGTIRAMSRTPSIDANVHLNPPGGQLLGTSTIFAAAGVSRFLDLRIIQRGLDYQIRFSSAPPAASRTLSTTQTIYVSFSNEFELRPKEAQQDDSIGSSVAISGSLAVVGAPSSNRTVNSIQTVTTRGAQVKPTSEIQIIGTHVRPQPAIVSFHTTAAVGATVGGTFFLAYGLGATSKNQGPTRPIPADVSEIMMKIMLEESISDFGNVTVVREPYIYCACNNAFLWTLTFNEIRSGVLLPIVINADGLTGERATAMGPIVVTRPALLGGTFTLNANGKVSRSVPSDGDALSLSLALGDLGYSAIHVEPVLPDISGARSWVVTFDHYRGSYDIPLLQSNSSLLRGGAASVWHTTYREGLHGPGGLNGGFLLEWRGNTTAFLPYDADAASVKTALEALPVVLSVNVQRSAPSVIHGYVWTIEFVEVMANTARGYQVQRTQNLEPIIAHNLLNGTQAEIVVGSLYSVFGTTTLSGGERRGTFGKYAGGAYIFQKVGDGWAQVATLAGNDTKEFDFFGSSVAIKNNLVVVGAQGASMGGVYDKQELHCKATKGGFRISFRGWTTGIIPHNVTRQGLVDAIVAAPNNVPKLAVIKAITVDDWGGGPLCDDHRAVFTFLNPMQVYGGDYSPMELLQVTNLSLVSSLGAPLLNVTSIQKGTKRPDGLRSSLQSTGAVYVFRTSCLSTSCVSVWTQEAQLFPLSQTGGDRFGYSLSTTGTVIVSGAPGSNDEKGSAYVYDYCLRDSSDIGSWKMLQEINYPHAENTKDYFGASVAIDDGTIVVGAPSYMNVGAVFVFKRFGPDCTGNKYAITQMLKPHNVLFPLQIGGLYGRSVAVSQNYVLVGSPERDESTIYLGTTKNAPAPDTGAVFAFSRKTNTDDFLFDQALDPSNVKHGDRFGWTVAIDGAIATVGSLEEYTGALNASKAIIEVKTKAAYNAEMLGRSFKLMWRANNATGEMVFAASRDIPVDTTALEMKLILETDLQTGAVLVSRSEVDVYDNGYSWLITFVEQTDPVSTLFADTTMLTGTNSTVEINFVNYSPREIRGKVHVFLNSGSGFVEEAFLSPFSHQPVDMCGASVAISGNNAIVGCPNRDSNIPNRNSGAASVFYLSLIHVAFSQKENVVTEGKSFAIAVLRDEAEQASTALVDTLFYVETFDRNAAPKKQRFIQGLYGILSSELQSGETAFDRAGIAGTAVGRASYYGSVHNDSAWVQGMYDYRAVSDYVPVYHPWALLFEYRNITDFVITTDDTIFEAPDENVTIGIHAPGIWPSVLGKLWSVLTIVDDADGVVNGAAQYDKLYQGSPVAGSHLGHSVSAYDAFGVVVTGCPDGFLPNPNGGQSQTGLVLVYSKIQGHYVQKHTFYSPNNGATAGGRFGDDVIVHRGYLRTDCLIVVGEPNQAKVHTYLSTDEGATFVYESTISSNDVTLGQHRFGAKGTLGLDGNLLVVGAPGLEAIFVVIREYSNGAWKWKTPVMMRSSDFDYDIMYGVVKLHRQYFGTSVAVSGRSVAVGAPFADYDKLGTDLHESDWDTEGSDIFGYARGRAYTFYSAPAVRVFTLDAPSQLTRGTFKIFYSHLGNNETTEELPFSASADVLQAALQSLNNIDSVAVSTFAAATSVGGYQYTWTVTFLTDWQDPGRLVPQWNGPAGGIVDYGCPTCVSFSDYMDDPSGQMTTSKTASIQPVTQVQTLSASDKRSGNRFGSSIALDGDQIVVGSVYSASITSTSWDFEAGTLRGWGQTGNAFGHQPTFGDNSYMRPVAPDPSYAIRMVSEKSNLRGNYYIGTYEMHPGDPSDYRIPDPDFGQGSYQGDVPVGTLTSEVFIIYGTQVKFLIGGGCDIYSIYVELLVDGFSVAKQTGKCKERMEPAAFNVSNYQNRAGQIRIVDASSSSWGHINVDDFTFDWDVSGALYVNSNSKVVIGGNFETPRSGIVYAFLRHLTDSNDLCGFDKLACEWTEEAKLMASDKRANYFFGASLSVDDEAGIVLVGSPGASYTGFYKETPSLYPFLNATGGDASNLHFPVQSKFTDYFQSYPYLIPEASGAGGVWLASADAAYAPDQVPWEESGAVYVFAKEHAVAINGHVSITQHWPYTEHARVQASDSYARDNFGNSVAIDGNIMIIGSIGNDGIQPDAGTIYIYNAGFASLYFATDQFSALEGTDSLASVTVMRRLDTFSGEISLEYATSDLTAMAVDATKFADCMNIATNLRGPAKCGDYQQTRGIMVIPANTASGGFKIPIMNDLCNERFPKFIQVTISVPGSAALQGESVSATVRIDDDDFIQAECL